MADALKNDRTAAAAAAATELAETFDVRHDPAVAPYFQQPPNSPLPAAPDGPSYPVLVDPYYANLLAQATVGNAPNAVPRVAPSYAQNAYGATRWFTLLDDMSFNPDGTPLLGSAGNIQRGDRFTWAYLLRRPRSASDAVVNLSVVVFSSRPTALPAGEAAFQTIPNTVNANTAGTNQVFLSYTAATGRPNVKRGGWILDTTYEALGNPPTNGYVHGYFYRVVGVTETPIPTTTVPTPTMTLELETALKADVNAVTVMENVAEVFDKGPGWAP
jgi:hypothetical protein